jgi:amino acid permease
MISIIAYIRRHHTRKLICPLLFFCFREYIIKLFIHTSFQFFTLLSFTSLFLAVLFFSREFLFFFVTDKSSNNNKKSKYDADDDDDEEDDKKKEKKNWFSRKRAGSLADSEADAQSKLQS